MSPHTAEAALTATAVQTGLLLFAAGLISGSRLGEWFHRREERRRAADEVHGGCAAAQCDAHGYNLRMCA
ncbi:hypothetical protein [Streptomyces sp. NBC_00996]|uniref:hypothetical protein n=1 Tax=Streptomyces sp. NBC_00996 TaxID=2903710 RepID=UPI00386B7D54|nr:hypothetical protein OG390_40740 [Streptomyces sp. NBC_00996]